MLITAKWDGKCSVCGKPIAAGTEIEYDPGPPKIARHPECDPPRDLFAENEAATLAKKLGFT